MDEKNHLRELKEVARLTFEKASQSDSWKEGNKKLENSFRLILPIARGAGIGYKELVSMLEKVSDYSVTRNRELFLEELKKTGKDSLDDYSVLESKIIFEEVSRLMSQEKTAIIMGLIEKEGGL